MYAMLKTRGRFIGIRLEGRFEPQYVGMVWGYLGSSGFRFYAYAIEVWGICKICIVTGLRRHCLTGDIKDLNGLKGLHGVSGLAVGLRRLLGIVL